MGAEGRKWRRSGGECGEHGFGLRGKRLVCNCEKREQQKGGGERCPGTRKSIMNLKGVKEILENVIQQKESHRVAMNAEY